MIPLTYCATILAGTSSAPAGGTQSLATSWAEPWRLLPRRLEAATMTPTPLGLRFSPVFRRSLVTSRRPLALHHLEALPNGSSPFPLVSWRSR